MDSKGSSGGFKDCSDTSKVPLPAELISKLIQDDETNHVSATTAPVSMTKKKEPDVITSIVTPTINTRIAEDDEMRPGAVRVSGFSIPPQQGLLRSRFDGEEKDEEGLNPGLTTHISSHVVAEVVDEGQMLRGVNEEQLLQELLLRRSANAANESEMDHNLLSRRQNDLVPSATVVVASAVEEPWDVVASTKSDTTDLGDDKDKNQQHYVTGMSTKVIAIVVVAVLFVIGAVVIAVVLTRPKGSSSSSSSPSIGISPTVSTPLLSNKTTSPRPATAMPVVPTEPNPSSAGTAPTRAPISPPTRVPVIPTTATPASLLPSFRSLLLNYSVSSNRDLFNQSSSQYRALNWLASNDQAKLNMTASVETIIHRYVLAVFYFSTNGYNWTSNLNFLTDSSICSWHNTNNDTGVLCSAANVLQELVIHNNSVSGAIPTELGKLSHLIYLSLADNKLTGTIPTELGMLSSLTDMWFPNNQLTGTIPTELGALSNLGFLGLDINQFNGTIPTVLGRLASLKSVDLSSNQFTGRIPTEFGRLTNLSYLYLGSNQLAGRIPTELGRLSSLTTLSLQNNILTGTVPAVLGALSNLDILILDHNNLTGNLTAIFCTGPPALSSLDADCDFEVDCSCCQTCS